MFLTLFRRLLVPCLSRVSLAAAAGDARLRAAALALCALLSCVAAFWSTPALSQSIPQTIYLGYTLPARVIPGATVVISGVTVPSFPVTFTSLTVPVCTISGNTITAVAAGICHIEASQAGNTVFQPAYTGLTFMVLSANPVLPTAPVLYRLGSVFETRGVTTALYAIDTSNFQTVNVVTIPYPVGGFAVSPDGNRLYVNDNSSGRVYAYDAETLRITALAQIEQFVSSMVVSPDGRTLYVATQGADHLLSLVNTANMQLVGTVDTTTGFSAMRLSADGSKLFLIGVYHGANVLVTVDTTLNKVTGTVPLTSSTAYSLAVSPAGDRAWVWNYLSGDLEIIDLINNKLLQTLPGDHGNLGAIATNLVITPDGKTIYGLPTGSGIYAFDTATGKTTASIATGYPFVLTITPDGRKVLVGDNAGILAVDTASNTTSRVTATCCASGMIVAQAATADASQITPQAGYWWNPAQGGTGFTIELGASGNLFFAGYLYSANGNALWYAAGPAQMNGSTFSAPLAAYAGGQTLNGSYQAAATTASPGNVSITFTDPSTGTLTWPGGTIAIQRYDFNNGGIYNPVPATQPQSGYWWNPAEGGRGYTIEVQNGTAFIAAYMYDAGGNPVWYASGPATLTGTGSNTYQGTLSAYSGGKTLTGNYQSPSGTSSVGNITIQFTSFNTATLTLPNGRQIPIQRYAF
jgi:DNA-binding beta-propeller fold protein YncE